jgi:uncharacterized protein (DUF488 family)
VLRPEVLTVGHSNHPLPVFLGLLAAHRVDTLVDVRSTPWSRRFPQFGQRALVAALTGAGITYLWHGEGLGARRSEPELRDGEGRVDYGLVAATPEFQNAIARVTRLAREGQRIALCCAEADPLDCHRAVLVARRMRGATAISHVLRDGTLESTEGFEARLVRRAGLAGELFGSAQERVEQAYEIVGRELAWRPAK